MLTNEEILQAVDAASLAGGPGSFVLAVGRAIEGKVMEKPIDMLLYCPNCGAQHVDAPDRLEDIVHAESGTVVDQLWTNPPHRSHLCGECGCLWRPSDAPTNGVAQLKTQGKADTWPASHNEEVHAMPAGAQAESTTA